MSYVPIAPSEIASGEPVSSTVATKIKNNLQNHEDRITAAENGNLTVYPPIILRANGPTYNFVRVVTTTCNFNLTVTGVFLTVEKAGSSGTTEIDVQYKRGAGAWTSILDTKPTVTYTAGDFAQSTNAVMNLGEVELQAGDLISLSITSSQTDSRNIFARIDFVKDT